MDIHTIVIDLGTTVYHLVGLNPYGEVVVRQKSSRSQLLCFTANLQVHLIGMEACGGSQYETCGALPHYRWGSERRLAVLRRAPTDIAKTATLEQVNDRM